MPKPYLIVFGTRTGDNDSQDYVLQEHDIEPSEFELLSWMYGVSKEDACDEHDEDSGYWWMDSMVWVDRIEEIPEADYKTLAKYL